MADQVKTASGETFSLTFTKGLPKSIEGPYAYLLYDGSIAMGDLVSEAGKQYLKTVNQAGMTPIEIAANKIIGHAPAWGSRSVEFA